MEVPLSVVSELLSGDRGEDCLQKSREVLFKQLETIGKSQKELKTMLAKKKLEQPSSEQVIFLLLEHAVLKRAASIHISNAPDGLLIRERINGQLEAMSELLPKTFSSDLRRALKEKAGISDANQRGFFQVEAGNKNLQVIVTALPAVVGESITLKLRDLSLRIENLEQCGFSKENCIQIRKLMSFKSGILEIIGKTGTGKSRVAYTMLAELAAQNKKIITLEDSIEIFYERIEQVEVESAQELDQLLTSVMQSDPDIIYIADPTQIKWSRISKLAKKSLVILVNSDKQARPSSDNNNIIGTLLTQKIDKKFSISLKKGSVISGVKQ